MKKYKILIMILAVISLYSCEKKEFPLYQENSGVYFSLNDEMLEKSYSFFRNPGKNFDTIYLDVNIVGNVIDRDRIIKAEVVEGENTDIPANAYEILDGVVPAGSTTGELPIIVHKVEAFETDIFSLEIKLITSEDFPLIDFAKSTYKVSVTSKISKPDNWDLYCSLFFGEKYSENWLTFIVETTGDPDIGRTMSPWFDLYVNYYGLSPETALRYLPDPILSSYAVLVKVTLRNYNNTHSEPLKHNDGTVIEMP